MKKKIGYIKMTIQTGKVRFLLNLEKNGNYDKNL